MLLYKKTFSSVENIWVPLTHSPHGHDATSCQQTLPYDFTGDHTGPKYWSFVYEKDRIDVVRYENM